MLPVLYFCFYCYYFVQTFLLLSIILCGEKMPMTCAIYKCRTGHKRKKDEPQGVNAGAVFSFPPEEKDPELRSIWIKFVNRVAWVPSQYVGICIKHFKPSYIIHGDRDTLDRKNRPIPTIYDPTKKIPQSSLPTPVTL